MAQRHPQLATPESQKWSAPIRQTHTPIPEHYEITRCTITDISERRKASEQLLQDIHRITGDRNWGWLKCLYETHELLRFGKPFLDAGRRQEYNQRTQETLDELQRGNHDVLFCFTTKVIADSGKEFAKFTDRIDSVVIERLEWKREALIEKVDQDLKLREHVKISVSHSQKIAGEIEFLLAHNRRVSKRDMHGWWKELRYTEADPLGETWKKMERILDRLEAKTGHASDSKREGLERRAARKFIGLLGEYSLRAEEVRFGYEDVDR